MGALGTRLALGVCLLLSACATAPKLTTSALEQKVGESLRRTRELDAEFAALKASSIPGSGGAAAAGGAYYNPASYRLQALEPSQAEGVHQLLCTELAKRGATRFEYLTRDGVRQFEAPWGSQTFDDVPIATQYATAAILSAGPALRGAETDLRVPLKDGGTRLVTVWNGEGASVEVADAAGSSLAPVAAGVAQADALRSRYGIGAVEGWNADQLAVLERALALLSPPELSAISGLRFRRESSPPSDLPKPPPGLLPGEGKQCGAFRMKPPETRIEIYDCTFDGEEVGFVGDTDRPLPPSLRTILHEIGHAIAKRRISDLSNRMYANYVEAKALVEEFNRQGRRIEPSELSRYRKMQEQMSELSAIYGRWQGAIDGQTATLSPVLAQFDQVRGGTGFTAYGRWNSDEAFAEAFSLYRADPAACKRISPPVFAYFDSGRHTAASPQ